MKIIHPYIDIEDDSYYHFNKIEPLVLRKLKMSLYKDSRKIGLEMFSINDLSF